MRTNIPGPREPDPGRPDLNSGNKSELKPVVYGVTTLDEQSKVKRFEEVFVVHLDAAYNLARRLARDDSHAEDVVQEACLRAFRFIDSFHGENGRAWLLAIVRNTYYTWLEKNRPQMLNVPFDEDTLAADGYDVDALTIDANYSVERSLEGEDSRRLVNHALDQLPAEFREVIVLRELEEMSYKDIATVVNIPIGTVMSRLARARKLLLQHLRQANPES
jgi:RNA polymerase sigma-70 factor, ECF subfamily